MTSTFVSTVCVVTTTTAYICKVKMVPLFPPCFYLELCISGGFFSSYIVLLNLVCNKSKVFLIHNPFGLLLVGICAFITQELS